MPRQISEELTRKEMIDPQYRKFVGVVARVESLCGRMAESTRAVEGLFESLLKKSFRP